MANQSAEPQYRRLERDWDELLFKANGAGLTLYVTVLTGLIANGAINARIVAILPCAIYFAGLCLAFVVHIGHRAIDEDIRTRERLNDIRTFVIDKTKRDDLPPEMRATMEAAFETAGERHRKLMTAEDVARLEARGSRAYLQSLGCFLLATFMVMLHFALFLLTHA